MCSGTELPRRAFFYWHTSDPFLVGLLPIATSVRDGLQSHSRRRLRRSRREGREGRLSRDRLVLPNFKSLARCPFDEFPSADEQHARLNAIALSVSNFGRTPHPLLLSGPTGDGGAPAAYTTVATTAAAISTGVSLCVTPTPPVSQAESTQTAGPEAGAGHLSVDFYRVNGKTYNLHSHPYGNAASLQTTGPPEGDGELAANFDGVDGTNHRLHPNPNDNAPGIRQQTDWTRIVPSSSDKSNGD